MPITPAAAVYLLARQHGLSGPALSFDHFSQEMARPKISENASETIPRISGTPIGRPTSWETDVTDTSWMPQGTMVSKKERSFDTFSANP